MPHINEKIDFTVDVYIVHKDKVLLRKHDKYNIWLGVGGHIELDEDPNQAALREVKEEVGLEVELIDNRQYRKSTEQYLELIPPVFLNRHRINPNHEHISLIYFANSKTDIHTNEGREASEDIRWFSLDELENDRLDINENIKRYALAALKSTRR